MSVANDRQVGGEHYRAIAGEQHWDRAVRLEFDFFQYMITKYIERWKKKNGIQDLEKALHFCQKYIETARAMGMVGENEKPSIELTGREVDALADSAEAALRNARVVDYLMAEVIMTESGIYTLPNGETYNCVKGKPTEFTWEGGYGDGRTLWTCNTCRNKVTTKGAQLPQRAHQCLGFDNRPRGHAHDAETKEICKRCDQRAVPQVCTREHCPHANGVDPVHVYDKDGRDKALFASRTSAEVERDTSPGLERAGGETVTEGGVMSAT